MAENLTTHRARRPILPIILIALALLAGFLLWQRAERQQRAEELAQAQGLVKVLSATFHRRNAINVGEVEGTFDVTSIDPGQIALLRSAQKVKLPYSVG